MSSIKIADAALSGVHFTVLEVANPTTGLVETHKITRVVQEFPNYVAKYIRDQAEDSNYDLGDEDLGT